MSKQTTLTDFLSLYKPWDIIYPTAVSVLFKNKILSRNGKVAHSGRSTGM